mmetsp:Transcript_24610/g.97225  ORF Transcript_24610/g.97225 Transcript_24610/m.97225 type:complete len:142 (-) Transcript_24610:65-490(-)
MWKARCARAGRRNRYGRGFVGLAVGDRSRTKGIIHSQRCSLNSTCVIQTLKGIDSKSIFANSFVLFGRMLNFVQSYLYYMQVEVIEPASQSLRGRMSREDMSIDNMMFLHDDFLGTCVKDCILTNAKILQVSGGNSSKAVS